MPRLSVLLPVYNGQELLAQNLPALLQALNQAELDAYEIICSDDASHDDSVAFLTEHYPSITVIENTTNVGFSGNVNRALDRAKYELVFILNTDVQLSPDYFLHQLPHFQAPDVFGVMGRVMSPDLSSMQVTAKYPNISTFKIASYKNVFPTRADWCHTMYLCGANALIDRKKMLALGGFNEQFNPYYSEDSDLGLSAWRAGYRLIYDHRSECTHATSSTIGRQKKEKIDIIARRNKIILHFMQLTGWRWQAYWLTVRLKATIDSFPGRPIRRQAIAAFWQRRESCLQVKAQMAPLRKHSLAQVRKLIEKDLQHKATLKIAKD